MIKNKNLFISQKDLNLLKDAIFYMKVSELKKICAMLEIAKTGKKIALINRIMCYVTTGTVEEEQTIPAVSKAENHAKQPLKPHALMLHGSYKNNQATRAFFKSLIGPTFHFTAFGIDWLNQRWLAGQPPTYQEFANYWIQEVETRKKTKAKPKKEWAYLNFMQHAKEKRRANLTLEWKKLRAKKVALGMEIIKEWIKK